MYETKGMKGARKKQIVCDAGRWWTLWRLDLMSGFGIRGVETSDSAELGSWLT
jgi:hypothetical protein